MASIFFMPRRGTKYKMNHTSKSSLILKEGELFVECPDSGVGTGPSKIKIGDGITAYSALPYALGGDGDGIIVDFDEIDYGNFDQNYAQIVTGTELGTLIALIKRCLFLINRSIADFATKQWVNERIATSLTNYYDKSYINDNYYTKQETTIEISSAIASALTGYYTKTEINNLLSGSYYTKTQSDSRYYARATIDSWFINQ